jgi:pyruvate kinase
MLSGETSVGKFPVGAVHVMTHVADKTEKYLQTMPPQREAVLKLKTLQMSAAVASGIWQIVQDLKAQLVVVWSQTGATARIFSKHRFNVPIIALSSDHRALRRMALHYGVTPQEMEPPADLGALLLEVDRLVQERRFAKVGDRIVITAGASLGTPSSMNGILIHTVGDTLQLELRDASVQLDVGMEA